MILVRPQNILFGIAILPQLIDFRNFILNKFISRSLYIGIAACLILIPQLIVWKIVCGEFILYSYEKEVFYFTKPALFKSLFSAKHGLIYWTPIVGLALGGLFLSLKRYKKIALLLIACFVLQWYLNASWHSWSYAVSFGN